MKSAFHGALKAHIQNTSLHELRPRLNGFRVLTYALMALVVTLAAYLLGLSQH
jgi:hypothetical protein